jgi:hypothetical protein
MGRGWYTSRFKTKTRPTGHAFVFQSSITGQNYIDFPQRISQTAKAKKETSKAIPVFVHRKSLV